MARAAKAKKIEAVEAVVPAIYVSQEEIINVSTLRQEEDKLAKQIKELRAKLTKAEGAVIVKLKNPEVVIEAGHYVATLDVHPGRCTPSWKDEACKLAVRAGMNEDAYVEEVKALYPPEIKTDLNIVHACAHCGAEKEIK